MGQLPKFNTENEDPRYGKTADCNSNECCTAKKEKCRRACVCTQMSSMTKEQYFHCVLESKQKSILLQIF